MWSWLDRNNDCCLHTLIALCTRVARWHIFKPKITIWVHFGGSCNGRCWYVTWLFGLFYGYLVFLCPLHRYNLWLFGIFFPFWQVVPRKIWQPARANETSILVEPLWNKWPEIRVTRWVCVKGPKMLPKMWPKMLPKMWPKMFFFSKHLPWNKVAERFGLFMLFS
jgi:hypothetical protein